MPATPQPTRHRRAKMKPRLSQESHLPRQKTSMKTGAVGQSPVGYRMRTSIQQGQIIPGQTTPVNSHYTMDHSPPLGANEYPPTPQYEPPTPPEISYGPVYPLMSEEPSENFESRGIEADGRKSGQSSKSGSSPLDPLQALSDSFSLDFDCHSTNRAQLLTPRPKGPHNKTEEIDAWLNELTASVRDDLPSLKLQQSQHLAGKDVNSATIKQHSIFPSEGSKPISRKESQDPVSDVRSSSNKENAYPAVIPVPSPTSHYSTIPQLAVPSQISPLRFSKNPGPSEDFPQIFPLRPSPKYFREQVSRNTRVISNLQHPTRKKPRTGPDSPANIAPKLQFPILFDETRTHAEALSPRAGQQFEGQGNEEGVIMVTPGVDKSETRELGAGGGKKRQVLGERRELEAELARQNYFLEGAEGVKFEFRV